MALMSLQRNSSIDLLRGVCVLLVVLRQGPLLLLVVLVLSVLHILSVPNFIFDNPGQPLGGAIAAALGLHMNWHEGQHGYLPASWDVIWSLSIEETFYLAFPLACILLGRTKILVPALVALAASLPIVRTALDAGGNAIWTHKAYLPGMSSIAVGVLAALLVQRLTIAKATLVRVAAWVGWIGVCVVVFAGGWVQSGIYEGIGLLLSASAACIMMAAHWAEAAGGNSPVLRGLNWLRSCGRLSYEIYLTHVFCVFGGVALYEWSGAGADLGFLWYLPIIFACWTLGYGLSRGFTIPVELAVRRRLSR